MRCLQSAYRRLPFALIGVAITLTAVTAAPEAHAAKVAIFNTGEDIFEVGPLPESLKGQGVDDHTAGYKCEVFGLFWAYITWWDCEPVIYKDDTYLDDEVVAEAVAAAYSEDDVKLGFWAGKGRWVVLLAIIGLIASAFFIKDEEEEEDEDEEGEEDDDTDGEEDAETTGDALPGAITEPGDLSPPKNG